jgi:hypothetical protein
MNQQMMSRPTIHRLTSYFMTLRSMVWPWRFLKNPFSNHLNQIAKASQRDETTKRVTKRKRVETTERVTKQKRKNLASAITGGCPIVGAKKPRDHVCEWCMTVQLPKHIDLVLEEDPEIWHASLNCSETPIGPFTC